MKTTEVNVTATEAAVIYMPVIIEDKLKKMILADETIEKPLHLLKVGFNESVWVQIKSSEVNQVQIIWT